MRSMLVVAMLACAAAISACSGGSDGPDTAAPTPVPTTTSYTIPTEISGAQLQAVTLALADFGPRYATFETFVDSELTATIERGIDACDPTKEQTALSKYGWTKGYSRYFGEPGLANEGSVAVRTNIDIYSTAANAEIKIRYDAKQVHEDQRAPGGCSGIGLERIEELALPQVGDQSWSARWHFSIDSVRGARHIIIFRRDRIVATVSITRFNSEDSAAELLELAKKVDERLLLMITAPLTSAEPANPADES